MIKNKFKDGWGATVSWTWYIKPGFGPAAKYTIRIYSKDQVWMFAERDGGVAVDQSKDWKINAAKGIPEYPSKRPGWNRARKEARRALREAQDAVTRISRINRLRAHRVALVHDLQEHLNADPALEEYLALGKLGYKVEALQRVDIMLQVVSWGKG